LIQRSLAFTCDEEDGGGTLAAALRRRQPDVPWSQLRRLCQTGKVFVDGARVVDPAQLVRNRQSIEVRPDAPRTKAAPAALGLTIVHEDRDVIVIDKPRGIATVPFVEEGPGQVRGQVEEEWTVRHLVKEAWRAGGRRGGDHLHIVHRLDRETSGLLLLARTEVAREALKQMFAAHDVERSYLAVAHGRVEAARIESILAEDRGDGLRGSVRDPRHGKRAVTHVEPLEDLGAATLVRCRLETGRTHQIRIHLSERGHPLVGERRYLRDYTGPVIDSERLALHAAVLGFEHPVTRQRLHFESPLPRDLQALIERIQRGGKGSVERAFRPRHRRRPGSKS
jgi:23S rRNA pseudouridine1911/1915/1917 synthase